MSEPPLPVELICRIKAPNFTAGFIMLDDVVVLAAPILKQMSKERWTRDQVRAHCKERGWDVQIVSSIKKLRAAPVVGAGQPAAGEGASGAGVQALQEGAKA